MRKEGTFYLGKGPPKTKPDVTITVSDKDMVNLSTGKLNVGDIVVILLCTTRSLTSLLAAANGLHEGQDQGQGQPDARLEMVCRGDHPVSLARES